MYLLVRDSKAELMDVSSLSGLKSSGSHEALHKICGSAPLSFLGYDENVCELKLEPIGEELE